MKLASDTQQMQKRKAWEVAVSRRLAWIGLPIILLWLALANGFFDSNFDAIGWNFSDGLWVLVGASSLALALFFRQAGCAPAGKTQTCFDGAAVVLMGAGVGVVSYIGTNEPEIYLIGAVAAALGSSWLLLRRGAALSELPYAELLHVMAVSALVLATLKALFRLCSLSVVMLAVILIALSLVSCLCLRAVGDVSRRKYIFYLRGDHKSLGFVVVFVLFFSIVLKLIDILTAPFEPSPISYCVEFALIIGLVAVLLSSGRRLEFHYSVKALIVITAFCSFFFAYSQGLVLSSMQGVLMAIREVTRFYILMIAADIAHYSEESPFTLFGCFWALCGFSRLLFIGFDALPLQDITGEWSASFTVNVMLLLILSIMTFSLLKPMNGLRPPLSDPRLYIKQEGGGDLVLNLFIDGIAQEHGLTPREKEVAALIMQGRSKSYIAETLFISENTVKYHSKNLYRKIGINSKGELLDLCYKTKGA